MKTTVKPRFIDALTYISCSIIIYLYYAPILIFLYWQKYVDHCVPFQGFYLPYIRFIDKMLGTEYGNYIEDRSYRVANGSNMIIVFIVMLYFLADIVTDIVLKKEFRIKIIFCSVSLVMMIFVTVFAAPYVINYFENLDC